MSHGAMRKTSTVATMKKKAVCENCVTNDHKLNLLQALKNGVGKIVDNDAFIT